MEDHNPETVRLGFFFRQALGNRTDQFSIGLAPEHLETDHAAFGQTLAVPIDTPLFHSGRHLQQFR